MVLYCSYVYERLTLINGYNCNDLILVTNEMFLIVPIINFNNKIIF